MIRVKFVFQKLLPERRILNTTVAMFVEVLTDYFIRVESAKTSSINNCYIVSFRALIVNVASSNRMEFRLLSWALQLSKVRVWREKVCKLANLLRTTSLD